MAVTNKKLFFISSQGYYCKDKRERNSSKAVKKRSTTMKWKKNQQQLKEFAIITLAVIIMDIGIYVFKFPNYFSFGGASGLAVVLGPLLPFTPSSINLFINLILLTVGFAMLGKSFGLKTTYVTLLSSILLNIMEYFFPIASPLTNQPGLELIYAIALPAVAAAMLFNANASGGGTDILAMILKKYTTLDISMALFLIDSVVVMAAFFLFDIKTCLYSVCGLVTKTIFIDKTIERMKLCKCLTIVCTHWIFLCQETVIPAKWKPVFRIRKPPLIGLITIDKKLNQCQAQSRFAGC